MIRHTAAVSMLGFLALGAVPATPGPEDLGSLGGSPFPIYSAGFGPDGSVVGATWKPGIGDVPFVWSPATGFRVLAESPGWATAVNRKGQVVGYLTPEGGAVRSLPLEPRRHADRHHEPSRLRHLSPRPQREWPGGR